MARIEHELALCPCCRRGAGCEACEGTGLHERYERRELLERMQLENERVEKLAERLHHVVTFEQPHEPAKVRADRLERACERVVRELRAEEV